MSQIGSAVRSGTIGTVTDVLGTINQITVTNGTSTPILSIPSVFIAPGSITASNNFTLLAGVLTIAPFTTSGMVENSASGVLSTFATTNHAVQVGNSAGQLNSLAVGPSGTVLIGNTSADPSFSATPAVTMISIANPPVNPTDGVNLAYVNTISAGFLFKNPVYASSTVTLTASYLNGTAGVGATLTNTGTLATFSIDGVTPALGSRILIKNQSTTYQNGIYTVTGVGSGSAAWVLTRSTDYNQPAQIAPGDLIPVLNGTVNANTFWLETAVVNTVGADPILFTQFFGGGVHTITTSSGTATVLSGNINLLGTPNQINTSASGSTVTLSLPTTMVVPGTLEVTSGLVVDNSFTLTAGDLVISEFTTNGFLTNTAGGTVQSEPTVDHSLMIGLGGIFTNLALGTSGQVLTSQGVSLDPVWLTPTTGTVTSVSGTVNQINSTGGATPVLSLSSTIVTPGTLTSTSLLTASNGFTVTSGAITFTPLNPSGIVINSSSGVITTTSTTNHFVQIGNSLGQLTSVTPSTANFVLTSNGTSADPSFKAIPAAAVGAVNGTANQITASAGPTVTLSIPAVFIAPGTVEVTGLLTADTGLTVTGTTTLNTPLGISSGGTNAASFGTTNGTVIYNGTRLVTLAVGSSGFVLTSNGASAPTFQALPASAVTSVTGTANQIVTSPTSGAVVASLPSTLIAPGSIASTTTITAATTLSTTAGNALINGFIEAINSAADGTGNEIDLLKNRAGGVIVSGDNLGYIFWKGFDGTQYVNAAGIRAVSTGTVATNRVAATLIFSTHPDSTVGGVTPTDRMTINSAGNVVINAPDSGVGLVVAGGGLTITGTTTLNTVLGLSSGGTNAGSFGTTNGTIIYNGTRLVTLAVGSTGFVLTSNGASAPTFQVLPTNVATITGTASQITVTGTTNPTLSLPNAITTPGTLTTTGLLTSSSGITSAGSINFTQLAPITAGQYVLVNAASGLLGLAQVPVNTARISNTGNISTSETILTQTSSAMLANSMQAGDSFRITLQGICTSSATNASTFRVRMGTAGTTADTAIGSASITAASTGSGIAYSVLIVFTVRSIGASSAIGGFMNLINTAGVTGISATTPLVIALSVATFDSTAANFISVTYQSAASTTTSNFVIAIIEKI